MTAVSVFMNTFKNSTSNIISKVTSEYDNSRETVDVFAITLENKFYLERIASLSWTEDWKTDLWWLNLNLIMKEIIMLLIIYNYIHSSL